MSSRFSLLVAAAAVLAAAAPARGQTNPYTFQFADTAGNPLGAFTVAGAGSTADVRVYLRETDGQNTLRTVGLFSGDVRVRFDSPGGVAAVLSVADILRNTQFDQQLGTGVTATAAVLDEQYLVDLKGVQSPADDPTRIYLGTFRFTGQSLGAVTLTAESPVANGGTLLNDGMDVSAQISAATASLTVVPEPGSWMLGGVAVAGLAALRRRARAAKRCAG